MSVMILGSGLSGNSVFLYLKRRNIDCFFADEKYINGNDFSENELDKLFCNVESIIVSPGISLKNNIIFQAKKRKIAVFGEFEFGASKLNNQIIAVTGTNGKTTTVNLINHLLKSYSAGVFLGGNVGVPVTDLVDKINGDELVVLECSSFQLETIKKFKPHIAVILNITEDHLNRHKTMREYIRCKYKITKNQRVDDYLILNADDELLRKNPPKTKAQTYYFSTRFKVNGVYLKNGWVYFYDGEKEVKLISIEKIKLKGEHNLSNILASILSVYLQTKNLSLLKNVSSFEGVAHRIEFVKNINGVEFYNDSKATNVSSCLVACKSFKNNVLLILGGFDKECNFDVLFKNIPKNVKYIAIFGENKNKIAFSALRCDYNNFTKCDTLEQCVNILFKMANKGDVVLLSPASASFDQFSNYKERGDVFKKIVNGFVE